MSWTIPALVGVGGFAGALARFYVSKKMAERFQSDVPYGTLTVNLLGSLLLGLLIASDRTESVYALAGTGFMGAFTTFSTLHVELAKLIRQSKRAVWLAYAAASYGGGLAAVWIGYWMGRLW